MKQLRIILVGLLICAHSYPVFAQVVNETITVDGKRVRMQKFTVSCSFGDLSAEGEGWKVLKRKYTFHLIDKGALDYHQIISLRPEANGIYNWPNGSWETFEGQDENTIWLEKKKKRFIETTDCVRYSLRGKKCNVYVNSRRGIDRTTLEMIIDHSEPECPGCDNSFRPQDFYPPLVGQQCVLTKYEKPKGRVGF